MKASKLKLSLLAFLSLTITTLPLTSCSHNKKHIKELLRLQSTINEIDKNCENNYNDKVIKNKDNNENKNNWSYSLMSLWQFNYDADYITDINAFSYFIGSISGDLYLTGNISQDNQIFMKYCNDLTSIYKNIISDHKVLELTGKKTIRISLESLLLIHSFSHPDKVLSPYNEFIYEDYNNQWTPPTKIINRYIEEMNQWEKI